MLSGRHRGTKIGSGTSVWAFCDDVKRGRITMQEFCDAEAGMSRSAGPLHDDGNGLDHGLNDGGSGPCTPHQCRDPGG